MNGGVLTLAFDSSGNLYAGGLFTTAGGVAARYIAKWNGASWSAMGGTNLNNYVYQIAFSPSGVLHICGAFTLSGGRNRMARWVSGDWASLGTGLNDTALCMGFDPSGNLYVGGIFTSAGGVTVDGLAKWNGTAWSNMPGGGYSIYYRPKAFSADPVTGALYIGASNTSLVKAFAWKVDYAGDGTPGISFTGKASQLVANGRSCRPVTAVAPASHHFVKWKNGGADYSTDATITVTNVTADMTLTANFAQTHVLTVANGSGSGTYPAGALVAITADAAPEYHVFDAWTGDIGTVSDPSDPTTFLTMPAASIAVAATYRIEAEGDFRVVAEAQTGGTVNGLGLYGETVEAGGTVVLTAAAEPGAEWTGWTGDHVGMDNPLTLTVFRDMALVATFSIVEGVTVGSASVVSATELGRGDEFMSVPKVWSVAFDPVKDPLRLKPKKLGLKGLTKIPKGAPQPSARYEHTKKVRLADMKALKAAWGRGTTTAAWLAEDPGRQEALPVRLIGQGKDAAGKYLGEIRWVEMSLAEITALRNAADTADVTAVAPLGQVLVKGEWFGAKAPKAWIEYRDPKTGATRQWKLKVLKPLRFANAAGKPASSCMNPATGTSEIMLLAPKAAPKGLALPAVGVLVIDNGVSMATVAVEIAAAGQ